MTAGRSGWWVLMLGLLVAAPAHAALRAVVHDVAAQREQLARLDTSGGVGVDPAGFAVPGCCRVNGALVASDDAGARAWLVTPSEGGAAARLHRFALADGAVTSVSLPAGERIVALFRRNSPATLFALSDAGSGLRLVTLSDAGAVGVIGSPLAGCCAVRVGVAALSADGSRVAFVGAPVAAPSPARLYIVATASGAVLSDVALAQVPDFLYSPAGTTFAASYHQAGTQFVGTLAADGTLTPVGTGSASCCAMLAGVGVYAAGVVHVVGRPLAGGALRLLRVDTTTGAFTSLGDLPVSYALHGLVDTAVAFTSDRIFRNGFEVAGAPPVPDADGVVAKGSAAGAAGLDHAPTPRDDPPAAVAGGGEASASATAMLGGAEPVPLPIGGSLLVWVLGLSMLVGAAQVLRRTR